MNNDTEPFWTKPPRELTWRDTVEHWINQADAAYCALWDWMPAIAAGLTLIVLVIVTPHR